MKAAVLYPGKQNHWIVALKRASGSEQDRADAARIWFRTIFDDEWEDLRVTGQQVGSPQVIRGNFVQRDNVSLPDDTTYVALAFDYLGGEDVREWPESATGQLWAVLQGVPTIHLSTPIEEEIDTIGRTIGDIKDDTGKAIDNAREKVNAAFDSAPYVLGALALIAWLWGSRNQR